MKPMIQYQLRSLYRKQLEQDKSPRAMVEALYNYAQKHHKGDESVFIFVDGLLAAHVENINYTLCVELDTANLTVQ